MGQLSGMQCTSFSYCNVWQGVSLCGCVHGTILIMHFAPVPPVITAFVYTLVKESIHIFDSELLPASIKHSVKYFT